MGEWHPVGVGGERVIVAGSNRNLRRVFDQSAAVEPAENAVAAGFSVERARRVQIEFDVGSFNGVVRLHWFSGNSVRWYPETTTITLPHAGAATLTNKNHLVQRSPFGMLRCAIEIVSNSGGRLEAWASGSDDKA